jgi:AcrR family transcriptional regulator
MEATRQANGRTPRGQGDLLRDRLIDAALEILDERQEPSEISIRGVTKRAGVSPTAFYLHFDDRESLMNTLFNRGFADLRRQIRAGAERGASPQQRLLGAGVAYVDFAREQPARYRLIFTTDLQEVGIVEGAEGEMALPMAAFDFLVDLIADYVRGGEPRDDLETLAIGFWSGLHGFATLAHVPPKMEALTDEQYVELLADTWLGPQAGE